MNFLCHEDWIPTLAPGFSTDVDIYRADKDEAWQLTTTALKMTRNWEAHRPYFEALVIQNRTQRPATQEMARGALARRNS